MPFLSVVMPVYNVEKYVGQAIESVLSQPCKDLELIIVDDGSPDDSGRICDEYASKDDRVTVIHKENEGVSEARNVGLARAKGKFVSFLDSDDSWYNGFFNKTLCSILNDYEYGKFVFIFKYVNTDMSLNVTDFPSGKKVSKDDFYVVPAYRYHHCSVIYPMNHIQKLQLRFLKDIKYGEDRMFLSNAVQELDKIYFDRYMLMYRYNPLSITNTHMTEDEKHLSIIKGRIIYAEFFKKSNIKLQNMNYVCIFGSIYEYLISSFLCGKSVNHVEKELTDAGFDEYYQNYHECSIPDDMKKKLDEYFKNKQLFRLKWYIRGIARRIMRRK